VLEAIERRRIAHEKRAAAGGNDPGGDKARCLFCLFRLFFV